MSAWKKSGQIGKIIMLGGGVAARGNRMELKASQKKKNPQKEKALSLMEVGKHSPRKGSRQEGKSNCTLEKRFLGRVGLSPRQTHMRSCESLRIVPKPLPCHSVKIQKPGLYN